MDLLSDSKRHEIGSGFWPVKAVSGYKFVLENWSDIEGFWLPWYLA
jgi:hypothetical protein